MYGSSGRTHKSVKAIFVRTEVSAFGMLHHHHHLQNAAHPSLPVFQLLHCARAGIQLQQQCQCESNGGGDAVYANGVSDWPTMHWNAPFSSLIGSLFWHPSVVFCVGALPASFGFLAPYELASRLGLGCQLSTGLAFHHLDPTWHSVP